MASPPDDGVLAFAESWSVGPGFWGGGVDGSPDVDGELIGLLCDSLYDSASLLLGWVLSRKGLFCLGLLLLAGYWFMVAEFSPDDPRVLAAAAPRLGDTVIAEARIAQALRNVAAASRARGEHSAQTLRALQDAADLLLDNDLAEDCVALAARGLAIVGTAGSSYDAARLRLTAAKACHVRHASARLFSRF